MTLLARSGRGRRGALSPGRGSAGSGVARHGARVAVKRRASTTGVTWPGEAGLGEAWLGTERQGARVRVIPRASTKMVRRGEARSAALRWAEVWPGWVWSGEAWIGLAGRSRGLDRLREHEVRIGAARRG